MALLISALQSSAGLTIAGQCLSVLSFARQCYPLLRCAPQCLAVLPSAFIDNPNRHEMTPLDPKNDPTNPLHSPT